MKNKKNVHFGETEYYLYAELPPEEPIYRMNGDQYHQNLLLDLIKQKNYIGIKLLLKENNANINWSAINYENGRTLLHEAILQNISAEIIDLFINAGANVNAIDGFHRTPLISAFLTSNAVMVFHLLERGANINDLNYRILVIDPDLHRMLISANYLPPVTEVSRAAPLLESMVDRRLDSVDSHDSVASASSEPGIKNNTTTEEPSVMVGHVAYHYGGSSCCTIS